MKSTPKSSNSLTVIIPAYKAEKFIADSIRSVKEVLDQTRYQYEIICVVDGKIDRTWEEAKKIAKKYPHIVRVVGYKYNLGKGHAVRFGMAQSKGDIVAFIDAGHDLAPSSLFMLLEHFEWYKADVIIGSKRHQASKVTYPAERKVMSVFYQLLVRILFHLNVRDTQVGVKVFKREVLEKVLPRLLVKAFAFDIEMLSVAHYLGYRKIYEAPVELHMDFNKNGSTIASKGFVRTVANMLWDTLAVFYRLRIRRYYDTDNKKNWITPTYLVLKSSSQ